MAPLPGRSEWRIAIAPHTNIWAVQATSVGKIPDAPIGDRGPYRSFVPCRLRHAPAADIPGPAHAIRPVVLGSLCRRSPPPHPTTTFAPLGFHQVCCRPRRFARLAIFPAEQGRAGRRPPIGRAGPSCTEAARLPDTNRPSGARAARMVKIFPWRHAATSSNHRLGMGAPARRRREPGPARPRRWGSVVEGDWRPCGRRRPSARRRAPPPRHGPLPRGRYLLPQLSPVPASENLGGGAPAAPASRHRPAPAAVAALRGGLLRAPRAASGKPPPPPPRRPTCRPRPPRVARAARATAHYGGAGCIGSRGRGLCTSAGALCASRPPLHPPPPRGPFGVHLPAARWRGGRGFCGRAPPARSTPAAQLPVVERTASAPRGRWRCVGGASIAVLQLCVLFLCQ